jgi:hypothetical protein
MEAPFPSLFQAPSTWYAAHAAPHRKSVPKSFADKFNNGACFFGKVNAVPRGSNRDEAPMLVIFIQSRLFNLFF